MCEDAHDGVRIDYRYCLEPYSAAISVTRTKDKQHSLQHVSGVDSEIAGLRGRPPWAGASDG